MKTCRGDRRDAGAALILTVAWSAVLLMLAGVVSAAVLRQIRPSDEAEASFQAWAAAEAGVDDARARLSADGEYWRKVALYNADPLTYAAEATANPALAGWVDLPGGQSSAQFTYFLDVSAAEEYGRIRVTSSGRASADDNAIVRTVDVLVQKRVSTDYAYLSNSETFPYDLPGAYGGSGQDGTSETSPDVAKVLCATGGAGDSGTYWYQWQPWPGHAEGGPKTSSSTTDPADIAYGASHRNSYACLHGVVSTDSGGGEEKGAYFEGPAHTNDVWYIDDSKIGNIDDVFNGRVTSSCPDGACPADHRWLSSSTSGGNSGEIGGGGDPGTYIVDEVGTGNADMPWNPEYEPILEMPSDSQLAALRTAAESSGCVFSGPTRIRFGTDGDGSGKVYVTSPDTKDGSTNSWCGTGYEASIDPANQATVALDYDTMVKAGFNGVFYVREAPEDARWSCEVKAIDPKGRSDYANYPWVIPEGEALDLVGQSPVAGLPDVNTYFKGKDKKNGFDAWTDDPLAQCANGHIYLEAPAAGGGYTGRYTVAADGDIVITDDVYEHTATVRTDYADENWGIPDEASDNQLGLVPDRWLYVYHLANALGGDQNGINAQLSYLLLDFAMLAKDKCLAVQDYTSLPALKDLKIVGALAQNARCRITDGSAGYNGAFKIVYDNRYKRLGAPPYMPLLSQEPWQPRSWSETNVRRDAAAKQGVPAPASGAQAMGTSATYGVLDGADEGTELLYARIVSGVGAVTSSPADGTVTYTAPDGVEHTIVEFVVRKPDGTRVGQQFAIDVS